MKNIKNFNNFVSETNNDENMNESWRQIKGYLKIPQILLELLLKKLVNFVPRIGLRYDELSAKIDFDKSLSPNTIKDDIQKLTINDIKNDNLRRTLKTKGIFDKWNVYYMNRQHQNRDAIYITKDELKKGDKYYGERISDHDIDDKYSSKKQRRYFKEKGVKNISELEPQFYVVAAVHSDNHDKMNIERKERYKKKKERSLEKLVDKCIKNDDLIGRSSSTYGDWSYLPVIHKVVKEDRIDLVQKIIDACLDEDDVKKVLNQKIDHEGWQDDRNGKSPIDFAKSEEMKTLLRKYM